jgi:hypothetical protein
MVQEWRRRESAYSSQDEERNLDRKDAKESADARKTEFFFVFLFFAASCGSNSILA